MARSTAQPSTVRHTPSCIRHTATSRRLHVSTPARCGPPTRKGPVAHGLTPLTGCQAWKAAQAGDLTVCRCVCVEYGWVVRNDEAEQMGAGHDGGQLRPDATSLERSDTFLVTHPSGDGDLSRAPRHTTPRHPARRCCCRHSWRAARSMQASSLPSWKRARPANQPPKPHSIKQGANASRRVQVAANAAVPARVLLLQQLTRRVTVPMCMATFPCAWRH
jgi:hypothetical protein